MKDKYTLLSEYSNTQDQGRRQPIARGGGGGQLRERSVK